VAHPSPAESSWYLDADVYELAFAFPPEREVEMLTSVFTAAGAPPPARLLEPMTGGGRLIPGLMDQGFHVFGFDNARPMLRHAARRAPGRVFQADAARFSIAPRFHGAFCLIDSFRYLLTDAQVLGFLESTATALLPDGLMVLELELEAPGEPVADTWTSTQGDRTARVTVMSQRPAGDDLRWMDATVLIDGPEGRREVRSSKRQRVWRPAQLERALGASPFRLEQVWRRTQEAGAPLEGLPRNGGPVTLLMRRGP